MNQTQIENLLQKFCYVGNYRDNMLRPFMSGDYICATDSRLCLFMPTKWLTDNGINTDFAATDNVPNACDLLENRRTVAEQEYTADYFNKVIEAYRNTLSNSSDLCEECNGTGTVRFNYWSDKKNEYYYLDGDCPICMGTGHTVKIYATTIVGNAVRLEHISLVSYLLAEFKKQKVIVKDFQRPTFRDVVTPGILFDFGEFQLLSMPLMAFDYEIKI